MGGDLGDSKSGTNVVMEQMTVGGSRQTVDEVDWEGMLVMTLGVNLAVEQMGWEVKQLLLLLDGLQGRVRERVCYQ